MLAANLHVTLLFLGDVDAASERNIIAAMNEVRADSVKLHLDQLSFWQNSGILCLTSSAVEQNVMQLQKQIQFQSQACGVVIDEKYPYCPHVTLQRRCNKQISVQFKPIIWSSTTYSLVHSQLTAAGPKYHLLKSWSFS